MIDRVLVIQPHNDDAVISIGGTLLKMVENGLDLEYIYLTNSMKGGNRSQSATMSIRAKEAEKERRLLGVKNYFELGYEDLSLNQLEEESRKEIINRIAKIIHSRKPKMVFIPSNGDIHPDHEAGHGLSLQALKTIGFDSDVFEYSVWLLPDFFGKKTRKASLVIMSGIDEYMLKKNKLIKCHRSQLLRRRYDLSTKALNYYFAILLNGINEINSKYVELIGKMDFTASPQKNIKFNYFEPYCTIEAIIHGKALDT